MKLQMKIATLLGALALVAVPATAMATQPAEPGNGHGQGQPGTRGPDYTPEPPAGGPGEGAKAYGWRCREESRKHVAGEKGTPFSQCVTAMARATHNEQLTAKQACRGLSKKHVKGEKGTAFSRCVVAAAKLKKEQREEQREQQS